MSAGPAEVTGLTQSIAYAQHLAEQAGVHGPDGNEGYLERLAAARVTGDGLATGHDMQQAFADAAAAAAAHAAELDKQTAVQEAYDQAPDAGDKTFLAGESTGSTADVKGTPVTSDDPDELYDAVADFINTTVTAHPQRKPAGQDLQRRMRDGEGGDNPWVSLPIRSTVACNHHDTVCAGCLDSWDNDHEIRIAAVPVTVDLDDHRASADEFYSFEGDPERQLPPYWVARHGGTVTSQIEGEPVDTKLLGRAEFAAAEFAGDCCDNTPGAPGAVRPGDRIEITRDAGAGSAIDVTASSPTADGYTVTGTDQDGRPVTTTLDAWQYEIIRRPVAAAARAAR